jgi:hypothetical protein
MMTQITRVRGESDLTEKLVGQPVKVQYNGDIRWAAYGGVVKGKHEFIREHKGELQGLRSEGKHLGFGTDSPMGGMDTVFMGYSNTEVVHYDSTHGDFEKKSRMAREALSC